MATLTQQAPWSQPFAQPAHTVSDANKTEPAQQLTLAHQAYRWSNPSMYTVHARPHFRSASSSDSSLSTMQKMPVYVDSSRSRSAPVIGKEIYPHSSGNTLPQKFTIHGDHITSFQEDGAKAQTYGRVIRTIESVSSPSLRELTGGRQIVQKLRQPLPLSAPSELAAEAPKRHNRHHSLDSKAGVIRAAGLTNATTPPARPPSLNSSCSPNPMSPSNGDVKKTERSSSTTAFHPAPVKPTLSTPPPSPLQSKTSNDEPGRPRASSPSPVRRVRGSSVDSTASSVKSRTYGPSPLSQPQFETSPPRSATPEPTVLISPEKTTIRNRLRRALSFGAKNELNKRPLKAQNEEKVPSVNAGPPDASIYGRKFFAISTDNLSIASTASSASLMLRKMGKGMKNGGKNFSEIFRQKRRVEPIVNKRETLDVSSEEEDVQRQATSPEIEDVRLGTPKPSNVPLEDDVRRRKSFAAGRPSIEKRRILRQPPEVLDRAAPSRLYSTQVDYQLPMIPRGSPITPSSPVMAIHKWTDSVQSVQPPHSNMSIADPGEIASPIASGRGSISFSPRTVVHETWTPAEYDRRGEIATCNRLTPLLAQQIKEELNSFKMVRDYIGHTNDIGNGST